MRARAVLVRSVESGASLETVETEPPQRDEVLVRLGASGICGSDLHVLDGRSGAATYPVVLGHEGAGIVEECGPDLTGLEPGDHVVLALYGPCRSCARCAAGQFVLCDGQARVEATFGRAADGTTRLHDLDGQAVHPMVGCGTLCEYAIVRTAQLVPVPGDVPLEVACLTACGVSTGLGAVFNTARVAPGDTVAVVGCGASDSTPSRVRSSPEHR